MSKKKSGGDSQQVILWNTTNILNNVFIHTIVKKKKKMTLDSTDFNCMDKKSFFKMHFLFILNDQMFIFGCSSH